MISIAVYPNFKEAKRVDNSLARLLKLGFEVDGLKNIFVVFNGKEVELFYPSLTDSSDSIFRINNVLPLSFRGETLLQVNEDQFDDESALEEFANDLIKNIHYIEKHS